jgi:hypothetical protein
VREVVRLLKVCEPDSALLPVHPPDAEQEVALVLDHVTVVEPP